MTEIDTTTYTLAGWHIDAASLTLTKDSEIKQLPAKVFAVLILLIKHSGQTVSHQVIYEQVWYGNENVGKKGLTYAIWQLRRLFSNESLIIHRDQRVGLVGANGSGKTSLFKIITGDIEVDQTSLSYPSKLRISYLEQEVPATDEIAIDYVLSGDQKLIDIQNNILEAEKNEQFESLGELYALYNSLDGYSSQSKAEKLILGLGFKKSDFKKSLNEFSGGWRARLNLAKTLMQPSDLMLLDEPTNHLDLDAILWLSNWIKSFSGALLLISHDREFLDDCVSSIAYLHRKSIELYPGNYSKFEIIKAERLAGIQRNYEKQQKEVAHMQNFIRRFKAKATKARQAQSRVKALERMEIIDDLIKKELKDDINENRTDLMIKLMIMAAIYEFMYMHKTPVKVVISEYIKVADFFVQDSQKSFLNAILDKASKLIRTENV